PPLEDMDAGHFAACFRAGEIDALDLVTQQGGASPAPLAVAEKVDPILSINHTSKFSPVGGGLLRGAKRYVKAVNDVSLRIMPGETLGLVGESGCGKSTLGRLVLRLDDPTDGEILFAGTDLAALSRSEMVGVRKK